MQRHELDEATDKFVTALQDKLPPQLSSFGPANPERLRAISRAHVEKIAGAESGKALDVVAPLVAELVGALVVVPAVVETAKEEARPNNAQ